MAKLGIADFETVALVKRRQQQLIQNLRAVSIDRRLYEGFEKCSEAFCGRDRCSDICRFGAYHRRVKHIIAAHDLITQCDEAIFEIRVARGRWVRKTSNLKNVSIDAAKKLNRRALDSLHNSNLVAIGAVKLAPANRFNVEDLWVAEIHELVAGAELEIEDLRAAFIPEGNSPSGPSEYQDLTWIRKVKDVGQTLSSIIDYRLKPWQDPRDMARAQRESEAKSKWTTKASMYGPVKLTRALWKEYYEWRFCLPANVCLIRYGCDRHFNKLTKEPRLIKERKKRRPYPEWLVPYMFGNRDQ